MKRYAPFAWMLAAGGLVYACSSSSSDNAQQTTAPDGGGTGNTNSEVDSGTPTESDSGSDAASDAGDGGSTAPVNPIEGLAAPKDIATGQGFGLVDGPVWMGTTLYFSDTNKNTVDNSYYVDRYTAADGFLAERFNSDGYFALGTTIDEKNTKLLAAEVVAGGGGRLVRWSPGAAPVPVTVNFDGGAANAWDSPNDVVVRKSDGMIFVTDPGYQKGAGAKNRLFRVEPNGAVVELAAFADSDEPNGIALSPDQSTLYVGLTRTHTIQKYALKADGSIGPAAAFATGTDESVDGLNVDAAGNVYAAAKGGVTVYKPDGSTWGKIALADKFATAVAFGGADRKTLYVTTQDGAIYEITGLKVAGLTQ